MGHDEMLQVLKEKMRLEGQLESLSSEANQVKYGLISVITAISAVQRKLIYDVYLYLLYIAIK